MKIIIDKKKAKEFKLRATKNGMTLNKAINEAIDDWLAKMHGCPVCGHYMYVPVLCMTLKMEVCPDCCLAACEKEWLRIMERKNYD